MSAYDFTDTLAVQILTYKKEHNENAAQFAKGCGVSAATIRRIENGDVNVKLSTADKLLRYMNITLIDLLPPLVTESPIAEGKERPRNKKATPAPQGEVAEKKILFSELLANIPSDEVLTELLPPPKGADHAFRAGGLKTAPGRAGHGSNRGAATHDTQPSRSSATENCASAYSVHTGKHSD